jgi:transposase, IS5 family
VHFPTDSTLLGDGIRVLSRSLKRIATECKSGALEVVNHGRAVKHRLLEIQPRGEVPDRSRSATHAR